MLLIRGHALESRRDRERGSCVLWPKYLPVRLVEEKTVKRRHVGRSASKGQDVDDAELDAELDEDQAFVAQRAQASLRADYAINYNQKDDEKTFEQEQKDAKTEG